MLNTITRIKWYNITVKPKQLSGSQKMFVVSLGVGIVCDYRNRNPDISKLISAKVSYDTIYDKCTRVIKCFIFYLIILKFWCEFFLTFTKDSNTK